MLFSIQKKQKDLILLIILILVVSSVAVYFRLYWLHRQARPPREPIQELATSIVYQNLRTHLTKTLTARYPDLNSDIQQELVDSKTHELIQNERSQFSDSIKGTARALQSKPRRNYLLGADSYYFMSQTKTILENGKLGRNFLTGRYFNPLQIAPQGMWSAYYIHPHIGFLWYLMFRLMNPSIELMHALSYLPLFLTALAVIAFFFVCVALKVNPFVAAIGAFAFSLAPVYLQRSAFGWFDTDPYNCLFPLLILGLYFWGTEDPKRVVKISIWTCIATTLYATLWPGWPIFCYWVIGSGLATALICRFFEPLRQTAFLKYVSIYFVVTVISVIIVVSPVRFYEMFLEGLIYVKRYETSELGAWPNIFLTVGEAQSIPFKKLIALTGNYIITGFVGIGALLCLVYALVLRSVVRFCHSLSLVLLLVLMVILSLQTERFALLSVVPIYLVMSLGMDAGYQLLRIILERVNQLKRYVKLFQAGLIVFMFSLIYPTTSTMALFVSGGLDPIMDDAWYQVLTKIEKDTEKNAIINSWWSPGHLIMAIARRRTLLDGANQHLPQTYWVARALFSEDEVEACGIFRMLDHSGNRAADYLLKRGFPLHEAIDLIGSAVVLSRDAASNHLSNLMSELEKNELLDLTHGSGLPPPGYVLIYDDIVSQNLALWYFAKWDFERAAKLKKEKKQSNIGFFLNPHEASLQYVRDVMTVTGRILKYDEEAKLLEKKGNILTFKNGLQVDLNTMASQVKTSGMKTMNKPFSLIYLEDGELKEIINEGHVIDGSALLLKQNGRFSSVLADSRLIRSVLFRSFYLEGVTLKFLEPFSKSIDKISGSRIYAYKINWEAFESYLKTRN
jgi:dolichyl-phosphooligosaccharide-protein glycotransferase